MWTKRPLDKIDIVASHIEIDMHSRIWLSLDSKPMEKSSIYNYACNSSSNLEIDRLSTENRKKNHSGSVSSVNGIRDGTRDEKSMTMKTIESTNNWLMGQ